MKKIVSIVLIFVLCLVSYQTVGICGSDKGESSLRAISRNNMVEKIVKDNYPKFSSFEFKDCYMVDMNNDSVPELFCIFVDKSYNDEYAVLLEYDNGYKISKEMPFNYNGGNAAMEICRILKKDNKFYYERYTYGIDNYDVPDISDYYHLTDIITINENGSEKAIYKAVHKDGKSYVNDKVAEIDYLYVKNNYEIVAESSNYEAFGTLSTPKYGKDYDKYWTPEKTISVVLDGKNIEFDQTPMLINDRTMVPLRAIFEQLGATVSWNDATKTITAIRDNITVSMTIGNANMFVNDNKITLDVSPQLVGSRTLVPVRAVSESFNCTVDWEDATQTVVINSKPNRMYKDVTSTIDKKMLDEFSCFVQAEAQTAEQSSYNILTNYDCTKVSDEMIREMLWCFMTDYSAAYMRQKENFVMFDGIHTEYMDYNLIRTQSWLLDMIIKDYYNISKDIPKFSKVGEYGPNSVFYSNYYYFATVGGRGASEYKAFVDKVYDIGNNQYYFEYKIGSMDMMLGDTDYKVSSDKYYAVMERKHLNNESFSNLEFWSVIKTSSQPILTIYNQEVIDNAKQLHEVLKLCGGAHNIASYGKVDVLLYNALNELDLANARNDVTLDIISTTTSIVVMAAQMASGDISSASNIGFLFESKTFAGFIDGVAKDTIKKELLNNIKTSSPDINSMVINFARNAYDKNSQIIPKLIILYDKFENNCYTYDDAVEYIMLYETMHLNRKTLSMAVDVLDEDVPDNILECLGQSAQSGIVSAVKTYLQGKFSGRGINMGLELYTDFINGYVDYTLGETDAFVEFLKKSNNDSINNWIKELEAYNKTLSEKLCVN